jgi:hypothetical protein
VLIGAIAGVNGAGMLATVRFTALAQGTSAVDLAGAILLDSLGDEIANTVQGGSLTVIPGVTAVPEPASLLLLGTGVVVVWCGRRRAGVR